MDCAVWLIFAATLSPLSRVLGFESLAAIAESPPYLARAREAMLRDRANIEANRLTISR
jgi:hypothetical protein